MPVRFGCALIRVAFNYEGKMWSASCALHAMNCRAAQSRLYFNGTIRTPGASCLRSFAQGQWGWINDGVIFVQYGQLNYAQHGLDQGNCVIHNTRFIPTVKQMWAVCRHCFFIGIQKTKTSKVQIHSRAEMYHFKGNLRGKDGSIVCI